MFFVIQERHNKSTDTWTNLVYNYQTENQAMHQYHAIMSTYGYNVVEDVDYLAAYVHASDGRIIRTEVDDRRVVNQVELPEVIIEEGNN